MTQVINLTPHDVNILQRTNNAAFDWVTYKTYPKSETPPRVRIHEIPKVTQIDGVNVSETFASSIVDNLPEAQDGIYYIVSRQVAEAKPNRTDLLIVTGAVRNNEGKIIGVTGFARIVEPREWVVTDSAWVGRINDYDKSNPDHGFILSYHKTEGEAKSKLGIPE